MGVRELPTLAEVNAVRRAVPKYDMATRLETKTAEDKKAKTAEKVFLKAVWARDKGLCRHCERKVIKSLELVEQRGEVHHIASRVDQSVRFDSRNGILLCARCHEAVERYQLHIIGKATQTFKVDGRTYLNADKKLQFRKAEK